MATDDKPDVFISYSSQDKEWVRDELLSRIEEAGLKAFIDFRDFTRGAPSIKEMARGVKECPKTLLVLTPDYLESEWCDLEVVMGQTLSPANRDLRLLPLLKVPCEKPLYAASLTHIDFTDGADHDLAWRQLLTALGKPPEQEAPKEPERDDWFLAHPYPMPPNFTGRLAEREMLTKWLEEDVAHPLLSLRALGGFGKSALVWHWLTHDVSPADWPRVVWWSFYEGDNSFDHFLAQTLAYLSGGRIKPDRLSVNDVRTLLQMLHQPGTLLVLDGFERALRAFSGLDAAYQGDEEKPEAPALKPETRNPKPPSSDRDCVSPLAELFLYHVALQPNLRSKVLLTTRLCPRILEAKGGGLLERAREEELRQMQPADAVAFFHAQGIRGTRAEIEAACKPYGYHPLSLRLLAGVILGDFQQPGDLAAAKRLDVSGDLVQRQHHVLETAYDSLTPDQRTLLGRIACFRSPVKYDTLQALAEEGPATEAPRHGGRKPRKSKTEDGESGPSSTLHPPSSSSSPPRLRTSVANLDADLRDLVARGLVHHDRKEGRFDLHPIVRRYAYDRLAAPDRRAAHIQLRDYFAAVPEPEKVTRLEDLAPVIELYHHTVRAGQFDEAGTLFRDRLHVPLHYQLGAYQLCGELLRTLFPDGEDRPPGLKDEGDQAWTLAAMGNSHSLSGQPRRAVPLFEQQIAIREKQGDKRNLARGLGNVAMVAQIHIGALRAGEANLRRSIALSQELEGESDEAIGHLELGGLLAFRCAYAESETELTTALEMAKGQERVQAQGIAWACRAQCELLRPRQAISSGDLESEIPDMQAALTPARRALELAEGGDPNLGGAVVPRDLVRAQWLLGAAHRAAAQFDEAERYLHEALERCRRINAVDGEADILIDLARLRAATRASEEAQRLADEALLITERSGYVLQGADTRLELAKLALGFYSPSSTAKDEGRDWWSGAVFPGLVKEAVGRASPAQRKLALEHAQEARRLATCDGPPDYTYKVAYDEAGILLTALGHPPPEEVGHGGDEDED